jgi:hypothetical protein
MKGSEVTMNEDRQFENAKSVIEPEKIDKHRRCDQAKGMEEQRRGRKSKSNRKRRSQRKIFLSHVLMSGQRAASESGQSTTIFSSPTGTLSSTDGAFKVASEIHTLAGPQYLY